MLLQNELCWRLNVSAPAPRIDIKHAFKRPLATPIPGILQKTAELLRSLDPFETLSLRALAEGNSCAEA